MKRPLCVLLLLLVGVPMSGAAAAYAGGLTQNGVPVVIRGAESQKTAVGIVSQDAKPATFRCAGPVNPAPHTEKCSGTNGALYLLVIVNRSRGKENLGKWQTWHVTAEITPPQPGVTTELGCDPSVLKDPHLCDDQDPALDPLPLARHGDTRYPITIKVDPNAPPAYGKELNVRFCLAGEGLSAPFCVDRPFSLAGGAHRPR